MKLQVGDLVQYCHEPERLGIVTMVRTTLTGAEVCEVVVVHDSNSHMVGEKRYLNQDYWKKAKVSRRPLNITIAGGTAKYEEAADLHKTYGES